MILAVVILVVTAGFLALKKPSLTLSQPPNSQPHDVPTGDLADAMATLEALPNDYSSLVTLGNRVMDEGNYPVAAECYKRALAMQGDSLDVRVDYGACLHAMGLSHRALEEFTRVIGIDSTHAIASFNMGIVYYSLNQMDSARHYWQKYLTIDPEGQAAQKAHELLRETGG